MELVRTPKSMDELASTIENMRGTQADLALVAIMAYQLGLKEGKEGQNNDL
jgi:hypothetical protein